MNKKVITLCAAALLFGGAGVNSSFALSKPTAVVYANDKANAVEIADGVKFLLSSSTNTYYQVLSVKTKDSKEVVTVNPNNTTDVQRLVYLKSEMHKKMEQVSFLNYSLMENLLYQQQMV